MSRFIQLYIDNGVSPYYYNYKKSPLLSLKEALEPVTSNIYQLGSSIRSAEILCNQHSTYNLTKDESAAICVYADDFYGSLLYHELNEALRSNCLAIMEVWFPYLKLFMNALEKLPTVQRKVWRAMSSDIVSSLKESDEIVWGCVNSCLLSFNLMKNYRIQNSVLCLIEVINAKDIYGYTPYQNMDEVVLIPDTRLRVKRIGYESSINAKLIHLIEIDKKNNLNSLSNHTSVSAISKPFQNISDKNQFKRVIESYITKFSNGDRYEVTYKKDDNTGFHTFFAANGEVFYESLGLIKASGNGFRISNSGSRWEGTFKDGKMNGYGILSRADGYTYLGDWYADEPLGNGISTWPNGSHYEGSHRNGRMDGYGTFHSTTGDKYQGFLTDGKAHGKGVRIWKNGDQYEGEFTCNKKHGHGTYSFAIGGKYIGWWANDEMNGDGVLQWPSKTKYEGTFKNGKMHGKGKLILGNGKVLNGVWENNKYIVN